MILQALLCAIALAGVAAPDSISARAYVEAVHELNEKHARDPGKETEEELAKKLPPAATKALESLLAEKPSAERTKALRDCAEAALDLDRLADFQKIRARLAKDAPAEAGKLDSALSRPRFVLRGVGGFDEVYFEHFADVFQAVEVEDRGPADLSGGVFDPLGPGVQGDVSLAVAADEGAE